MPVQLLKGIARVGMFYHRTLLCRKATDFVILNPDLSG